MLASPMRERNDEYLRHAQMVQAAPRACSESDVMKLCAAVISLTDQLKELPSAGEDRPGQVPPEAFIEAVTEWIAHWPTEHLSWRMGDLYDRIVKAGYVRSASGAITDNDRRWRLLEHGCQWVSFTPIGGETKSFDPRDVRHLQAMRAYADEVSAKQMAQLVDEAQRSATPPSKDG